METQEKLIIVQDILREKKAEDVEVIELGTRTLVADYFVIASGTSNTHIKGIVDGLLIDGKQRGLKKDRVEGYREARWVLVDFGDIVVHIFAPEERAYYDVESLWRETAIKLEGTSK